MKRAIVAIVAALLVLTACGGPRNTDPRIGRVVLEEENCITGGCFIIYKVCQGPDLVFVNTALDDDLEQRVVVDSPECEGGLR